VLFNLILCNVYADIIFSAPPRESEQQGNKIYGPIAQQLSKVTGKKVIYQHAGNWTEYSQNMRQDKYDIIFDGPHFAAWRIKHFQHTPVAKLAGTLGFVIIAKDTDKDVKHLRDLIGKSLCGMASPNLGTMVAFSIFNNPVIQPEIRVIKGSGKDVLNAFVNNECHYAVLLDRFYNNLPAEKKLHIKVIATSNQMPNQTFTVSKHLSHYDAEKIANYLTTADGARAGENLLKIYSQKTPNFEKADIHDYEGLEGLLEGVVFGW
jgi:ABC-type phosphate/phosphonate transport system substrate-binding protein